MCMEDLAIQRNSFDRRTTFASGANQRLAADPNRIAVRFCIAVNVANAITIARTISDLSLSTGVARLEVDAPGAAGALRWGEVVLNIFTDGPLVTQELFFVAGSGTIIVTETLVTAELGQAIIDFARERFGL